MTIGEKILIELDRQGKQKTELAEYIGIAPASVGAWANSDNIRFCNVVKAAEFLNVSLNYLAYNTDVNNQSSSFPDECDLVNTYRSLSSNSKNIIRNSVHELYNMEMSKELNPATIDIKHSIFKVSAGIGEWLSDPETWDTITVIDTPQVRKADFSLTIQGDSMMPDYEDGDIILVRSQPAVNINDICVYYVNGKGYIKKFGGDRLISLNPKYPDIVFSDYDLDEIHCWGLVVGVV